VIVVILVVLVPLIVVLIVILLRQRDKIKKLHPNVGPKKIEDSQSSSSVDPEALEMRSLESDSSLSNQNKKGTEEKPSKQSVRF
jgi:predicted Holliday junction resolvase-like endonuclease